MHIVLCYNINNVKRILFIRDWHLANTKKRANALNLILLYTVIVLYKTEIVVCI